MIGSPRKKGGAGNTKEGGDCEKELRSLADSMNDSHGQLSSENP